MEGKLINYLAFKVWQDEPNVIGGLFRQKPFSFRLGNCSVGIGDNGLLQEVYLAPSTIPY
jgi:hypothetical protein